MVMNINLLRQNFTVVFLSMIFSNYSMLEAIFEFSGKDSSLEFIGDNASLYLESNIEDFTGTLKFAGNAVGDRIKNLGNKYIDFKGGILNKNGCNMAFFGMLGNNNSILSKAPNDQHTETILSLKGNQNLVFDDVLVNEHIQINGKNNVIVGRPRFENKIVLANSAAELELIIQGKLTQNIVLNGGTLLLGGDLSFKDYAFLEGDGVVDIQNFRLSFPSKYDWTMKNNLVFLNANDLQLNGYTVLDGTWTFSGDGLTSTLNGYGNVLDITGGGTIYVGANHTLFITGVALKGLGIGGGNLVLDETATVKVSSTVLELAGDFFLPSGKVAIISPNCKLIVKEKSYWVVSGPSGSLDVDGVVFLYEALGSAPIYPPPFYIMPGGSINQINSGIIQSINFDLFKGEYQFSLSASQGENQIIGGVNMTTNTIVHFINENPAEHKEMVLNCNNKTIKYDIAEPGSLVVDENINVLIKNLVMDNFDAAIVELKGAGPTKSTFLLGDDIIFNASRDVTLTTYDLPFVGNSTLNFNNAVLTIPCSNCIVIGNGKTLTIKNAVIKLQDPSGICCLDDESTILFQNVVIEMGTGGWLIDKGSVTFKDYVEISTPYVIAGNSSDLEEDEVYAPFNFTSKGLLSIAENSSCKINGDIEFLYNPLPASIDEPWSVSKRRLTFADETSSLIMEHCKVDTCPFGMAFDHGQLKIIDRVFFSIDYTNTMAFLEFSSNFYLKVASNSSLNIDGPIKYFVS